MRKRAGSKVGSKPPASPSSDCDPGMPGGMGRAWVPRTTRNTESAIAAGTMYTGRPKGMPRVRIGCSRKRYETMEIANVIANWIT